VEDPVLILGKVVAEQLDEDVVIVDIDVAGPLRIEARVEIAQLDAIGERGLVEGGDDEVAPGAARERRDEREALAIGHELLDVADREVVEHVLALVAIECGVSAHIGHGEAVLAHGGGDGGGTGFGAGSRRALRRRCGAGAGAQQDEGEGNEEDAELPDCVHWYHLSRAI